MKHVYLAFDPIPSVLLPLNPPISEIHAAFGILCDTGTTIDAIIHPAPKQGITHLSRSKASPCCLPQHQ